MALKAPKVFARTAKARLHFVGDVQAVIFSNQINRLFQEISRKLYSPTDSLQNNLLSFKIALPFLSSLICHVFDDVLYYLYRFGNHCGNPFFGHTVIQNVLNLLDVLLRSLAFACGTVAIAIWLYR